MKWFLTSVAAVAAAGLFLTAAPAGSRLKVTPKALAEFDVNAKDGWTSTGVIVQPDVTIDVLARGTWVTSPPYGYTDANGYGGHLAPLGYVLVGAPEGSLIGRVSGGRPFFLGTNGSVPPGLSGALELISNDDYFGNYGPGYSDNSGSIHIKIFSN